EDRLHTRAARRLSRRPEIRRGRTGLPLLRRPLSGVHPGRRPDHVRAWVGFAPGLQYPTRAGAPVRSDFRRRPRRLPRRSGGLARDKRHACVTAPRRRWTLLVVALVVVLLLVGGRWLALE